MISLPKQVRHEANQAAHRLSLRYEIEVRNSLLAQLKTLAENGATLDELANTLTKTEARPLGKLF